MKIDHDNPPGAGTQVASATRPVKAGYTRALDIRHGVVDMSHGAGGKAAAQLIAELFAPELANPFLGQGDDGAALPLPGFDPAGGELVMATDAHVVSPLFFPGGDLGCLAVHGTINDVAMLGARPLYLSASFILEEGFALADLQRLVRSMGRAAAEAGVPVVTGDTKVVERGKGDGVFISTTGVGVRAPGLAIGGAQARAGDAILVSGTVGDHGLAVLSQRESLAFDTTIVSDTAALHTLVADLLAAAPGGVRVLRDPTRGGLATTLNEIAQQSGVGMRLQEAAIPVTPQVDAACELLGLDPLYVANEGKLIAICAPEAAEVVLGAMRRHPLGQQAARIGTVTTDPHHFVQMDTRFGGRRVVDWLSAEPLPRIC
ncbi:MAG: hydrogenase expression/formation protein HypE [Hydrogenophaga sp.]|uniref:hydrogenase expression/formation protein HypE n=1 Tax=Hydrogenophaga sp. TaxID=1904254 RepID=UPI001D4FC8E5|nr:hydrogenase expression/formation protein HypE [Hydrogenophaga sp.]MBX3609057.1 hydrogenase expression/formation protein HypE [Hydrogenophaga sp.]